MLLQTSRLPSSVTVSPPQVAEMTGCVIVAARIYFHLKQLFIPACEYVLPSQLIVSLGEELIWMVFLILLFESFFILSSFLNHVLPHGELWAANFFYCFKDVASLSSVVVGHPFLSSSLSSFSSFR